MIIRGHEIFFPFDSPYPGQISAINNILLGLERSQNILFESPTGTGKTLSLLCSTLAHQKKKKETGTAPVIIYSSATHAQLSSVVEQLKNTEYRYVPCIQNMKGPSKDTFHLAY